MSEARMREVIREQVAASMAEFMENINHGAGSAGAGGGGAGGGGAGGGGAGGGGAGSAGASSAGAGGARAGGAGAGGARAGGAGVGGAGPTTPETTGCTYVTFMKCDPQPFKGTKGAMGLCQWFEKLEYVFRINDCKERDKVKFATATLQGRALTWWNRRIACMGINDANDTPWTEVKVEQYIRGLSKNIRGDVTSSRHVGIDEAVRMAYQFMGQIIQDKTDEASKDEKRKGEGDRGGRGDNRRDYNRRQNQRRANAGAMTNAAPNDNEVCPKCKNKKHAGDCWKCGKCGKLGHKTAACWSLDRKDVTCFNCNEKGHRKRDCPKLKKNGQGGNNHGAVYKLGAVDAQQDSKVVTGTFLLNNRYATALFDSGADKSFVSTNFSTLIDIEPVELDTCYDVKFADGKVSERTIQTLEDSVRELRNDLRSGSIRFDSFLPSVLLWLVIIVVVVVGVTVVVVVAVIVVVVVKVLLRVSYQVDVRSRESSEFYTRHHDAQTDRAAVRAEIERHRVTVLETDARRHDVSIRAADDLAVSNIKRYPGPGAGALR
ncbi:putative reverse transcriptase domain-containing protein [Tanacetum coccineum]